MYHRVIANYSWIRKICYKMCCIGLTNNLQNDKMSKRNQHEMQKNYTALRNSLNIAFH